MSRRKKAFGYFSSLKPDAGNVEYNNAVFNSMMMSDGVAMQGTSQAVSEEFNSVTTPESITLKIPTDDVYQGVLTNGYTFGDINREYNLKCRTEWRNTYFTGEPEDVSKFIHDFHITDIPSARYVTYVEKALDEDYRDESLQEDYEDDYQVISYDEALEGMVDNASQDDIDYTIKQFNAIARKLQVKPRDLIIVKCSEQICNPTDYGFDLVDKMKSYREDISIYIYQSPEFKFVKSTVQDPSLAYLYFSSEADLIEYLNQINNHLDEGLRHSKFQYIPTYVKASILKDEEDKFYNIIDKYGLEEYLDKGGNDNYYVFSVQGNDPDIIDTFTREIYLQKIGLVGTPMSGDLRNFGYTHNRAPVEFGRRLHE